MTALIRILTHNRPIITKLCLPTIIAGAQSGDEVHVIDDASVEYDAQWISEFVPATTLVRRQEKEEYGVETLRWRDIRWFFESSDKDMLCMVDNDALCDPAWRVEAQRLMSFTGSPVAMFNPQAHDEAHTLERHSDHLVRSLGQGVCFCLNREMASRILEQADPDEWKVRGWDWCVSELFGRVTVAYPSFVEHLGWNGLHSKGSTIHDYRDFAMSVTPRLAALRLQAFEQLKC